MSIQSLGERLREARRARKVTQAQLAKAAGVKQPSISELETGETKMISGDTLIAISSALRVRPEWLLTNRGQMEDDVGATLSPDERQLLANYRAATPRWRVSLLYMSALKGDTMQDEAAESMNIVLAKIVATPVPDKRVEETYGFPPSLHEPKSSYAKTKKHD